MKDKIFLSFTIKSALPMGGVPASQMYWTVAPRQARGSALSCNVDFTVYYDIINVATERYYAMIFSWDDDKDLKNYQGSWNTLGYSRLCIQ